jgi:hypothetical protein
MKPSTLWRTLTSWVPWPARPVRVAVLGVRALAAKTYIKELRQGFGPGVQLVLIIDPQHPAPWATVDGVRVFLSLEEALAAGFKIDLLLVADWTEPPAVAIENALLAGIHVVCDPGFGSDPDEEDRLMELARRRGVSLIAGPPDEDRPDGEPRAGADVGRVGQVRLTLLRSSALETGYAVLTSLSRRLSVHEGQTAVRVTSH